MRIFYSTVPAPTKEDPKAVAGRTLRYQAPGTARPHKRGPALAAWKARRALAREKFWASVPETGIETGTGGTQHDDDTE
jgi:hypothetical protein